MGLTTDLILACDETNRAGLARLFLIEACDVTSITVSNSEMTVTAITLSGTADVFYEFEAEFEQKDIVVEGAGENGTPTFTVSLNATVLGLDKTKLQRLQDIADSRKIVAIAETTNSTGTTKRAFLIGFDSIIGRDAAAKPNINAVIEGPIDGVNSATLTLTAKHAELIREVVVVAGVPTNASGTVIFGS
ncbi:MAG: hypothetical protein QQN63_05195 [Nitrosopumilus sp.]